MIASFNEFIVLDSHRFMCSIARQTWYSLSSDLRYLMQKSEQIHEVSPILAIELNWQILCQGTKRQNDGVDK